MFLLICIRERKHSFNIGEPKLTSLSVFSIVNQLQQDREKSGDDI